eukprot:gnl/TRDRNA2_/TRDRNA2_162196_c0_seq2.p1 gnl/TRDRNA2_/TRDRNA2_162196_c0~~gnl/TRDRNA2_/TRDRNA2_162196_c0_seq2.p1  ORF type:complete len:308 (-),score=51.63 gnl/TRDRNA2_/TRDRNA2_162196_c0_seq2:75-968(-)
MVFQEEESRTSWLWPLIRRSPSTEKQACCDAADDRESDRYFDIADSMEKGLARELVTDFMQPLRKASKLWKFRVERGDDRAQYRLYCDNGEFLMYARAYPENMKVCFFLYDPLEKSGLFDVDRPAFTMACNQAKTEWRLVQERCEHCQYAPKHLSCADRGKQQVAHVSHFREPVGDGIINYMDVKIPGIYSDNSRVIWCPMLQKTDLGASADGSHVSQRLVTKKPKWNEHAASLVLDFRGRTVLTSAKNFQLSLSQKRGHTILQHGKIGENTFSLDFRYPLSVVQAFAIAMTTIFWK